MMSILKHYWFVIFVCFIFVILLIFYPIIGQRAYSFTIKTLINFLLTIPPIFICIGLLDVWIDKEHMVKAIGKNSGIKGVFISFLCGTVTAVPLYALLPIAGILLKKECKLSNILIFICSSASIRIPLLLFEISSLGWKFAFTRCLCNILIVLLISWFIEKALSTKERETLYQNAKQIQV